MSEKPRAQSEVVGVALLIGVFAVFAMLVGTAVIGNVTDQVSDEPLVDLNASATTENLTLTHGGGDALEGTDVTILLRQGDSENVHELTQFDEIQGRDTARFAAGERWTLQGHGLSTGLVRVLVVHRPSNAVVHDEQIVVPSESNARPEAQFDYTPVGPDPGDTVTVNATDSSDPDGNITSYSWDFGDGTLASGPITNHSYSEAGAYTISLTVTDDRGAATTTTKRIAVDSTPPSITNATLRDSDGTVTTGDTVTISADVTDAITGVENVTADASSLDADTVTLTDDNSDGSYTTTATVGPSPVQGEQSVTIEAADADGNTATNETNTLTVDTDAPSISDPTLSDDNGNVTAGDTVTISANVSDNLAGLDSVTADASSLDVGTVTLTDDNENGTYTATVTVGPSPTEGEQSATIEAADTVGNTGTATTNTLTVDTTPPQITNPTLSDGDGDGNVASGDPITISADVSDNPAGLDSVTADAASLDAGTVTLTDDNGDGTHTSMAVVGPNATDGEQSATIEAIDGAGNVETATTNTVEVNAPPKASFSYTPSQPSTGEQVTFDASNSTDPDGTIVSYEWDFDGDGTVDATGETATHSYDPSGNYTATLQVTDSDGATNTTSQTVRVYSPPVANYTYTRVGDQVTFDASGSYDPDGGSITGYEWDIDGDGFVEETGETVTLDVVDEFSPSTVELVVTDDEGVTNSTTKQLPYTVGYSIPGFTAPAVVVAIVLAAFVRRRVH